MIQSRSNLVCTAACLLALSAAASALKIGAQEPDARILAVDDVVSLPRTFRPGSIVDLTTDVVAATINKYDFATDMVTGSSIVYTFDVEEADTYDVSYGLAGGAQIQDAQVLKMAFMKGRQKCPPMGNEGAIYVEKFTTGDWNTVQNYLGTPITLAEGKNQEYTLCFERAAYVNLNYICIGPTCGKTKGTIDASNIVPDVPVPLPEVKDTCIQWYVPYTTKQDSCIEVLCVPEYISLGTQFNLITRFCNGYPRKWEFGLHILDDTAKGYVQNIGGGIEISYLDVTPNTKQNPTANMKGPDGDTSCAEYTFAITLDPNAIDKSAVLTWQFLMFPVIYDGKDEAADIYPNVIAQSAVFEMPKILPQDYAAILGNCPVLPTRTFNREGDKPSDMIRFPVVPDCIERGETFTIYIDVHLETVATADLRVNLQVGSGPDLYLGTQDVFLGESNEYGITEYTPKQYWTRYEITFSAKDTKKIAKTDNLYLVAFLVPKGSYYDQSQGGWKIIDREYNLSIDQC